jgi:hypothetical protein
MTVDNGTLFRLFCRNGVPAFMLSRIPADEECDARNDDSSTAAGKTILINIL